MGSVNPGEPEIFPSAAPAQRFGDLLPLPLPPLPGRPADSTRSAVRRLHRAHLRSLEAREIVFGFNYLAGYLDASQWPLDPVNAAQHSSVNSIRSLHAGRSWPKQSHFAPRAALKALLRQDTGYSLHVGGLVSYQKDCVSLPRGQVDVPRLADLVPPAEREQLENFRTRMMLAPEEIGALCDDIHSFAACHHDARFDDPAVWASFVAELYRAELIRFTDTPARNWDVFLCRRSLASKD